MRLSSLLYGPTERSTLLLRSLAVCLSAASYLLFAPSVSAAVVLLWAGYLCVAGLVALRQKPISMPLSILIAAADVGAISMLVFLSPPQVPALWFLYTVPIAAAAISGTRTVAVAAVFAIGSWLAFAWRADADPYSMLVWPIAFLLASAATVALISGRWAVERSHRAVWEEATLAGQLFWSGDTPDESARSVIESLVRLAGADHGWLVRTRPGNAPVVVARSSHCPDSGPSAEDLFASFGSGSGSLLSGPQWQRQLGGSVGEVIPLRTEWDLVGGVALAWNALPGDSRARRAAVRALSSGAAAALVASEVRSALRREIRLEGALHQMGNQLVSTLEPVVVATAVKEGIASVIGGSVMLETAEWRAQANAGPAVTIPLRDGAGAMHVFPQEESISDMEKHWLDQVAELTSSALSRCAQHSALKAEETRLRAALESLPSPAILTGSDGSAPLMNRAYRNLCGPGRKLPVTLRLRPGVEEEAVFGEPPRTFVVSTAPVGEMRYQVSVFREVTREREALRVKDELIAMAGHELRSPLTSISGYSQMMAKQLGVVQRQIGQLDQLIGDFIEASSFDDAHLSLRMEALNLADIARSAAERFAGSHVGRPLRLEIAELPEIQGDPTRLGQVLDNLLSNAHKYSPREDAEIVLGATKGEDSILLWVRDHGLGIDQQHLPLLFERYYRVRSQETQGVKGLGLGLAIVRELAEAHGGSVWAESPGKDQGSTFFFRLPARTA